MLNGDLIKYWIDASDVDFRAMNNLFNTKDYVWSLFIGHLVIEKLLKAIAVKNGVGNIPKIHNLNKIAVAAGLNIDDATADLLDAITAFNIEARYPDYKKEFYKKADQEFTFYYYTKIKEIRLWLINQLMK